MKRQQLTKEAQVSVTHNCLLVFATLCDINVIGGSGGSGVVAESRDSCEQKHSTTVYSWSLKEGETTHCKEGEGRKRFQISN